MSLQTRLQKFFCEVDSAGAHLGEATWLEHGGHDDEVAARIYEVAQGFVISETEGSILAAQLVVQGIELCLDLGVRR